MSFVIPAIDLKGGKCVQLEGGDPNKILFQSNDPIGIAERLSQNFDTLHVVDLDAAQARLLIRVGYDHRHGGVEVYYERWAERRHKGLGDSP